MSGFKALIKKSRFLRTSYMWMKQFADPIRMARAVFGVPRYLRDWRRYARLPGAEPTRMIDTWPQFHDRTDATRVDAHYFYVHGWAMRRIVSQSPAQHVDIGSLAMFVNLLSAVIPVVFVDYRPLTTSLNGLTNQGGDILNLAFPTESVTSLSCLHVAEHVGLGRYGDPLNPHGTREACRELQRVLAPGGNLYFALPIGRARTCFNAHRIHAPETVMEYFAGLDLMEFSAVQDDGRYVERATLAEFSRSEYACGMFWFRKPRGDQGETTPRCSEEQANQ